MTQEQIIEGNQLIAEFMGAEYQRDWSNGVYKTPLPNYSFAVAPTKHASYNWSPEGLEYNLLWEWLMPVVEDIKDIDNQADIEMAKLLDIFKNNEENCNIFHTSIFCHLEEVWNRVVVFIQWYNKNT
jgi:hypothetical protein